MKNTQRGYSLLVVMVLGTALAAVAGALLMTVARDRVGARKQSNVLRALYNAEGAVAFGVEAVRQLMAVNPSPSAAELAAITAPTLPETTFEAFHVAYIDPTTLAPRATPALSQQTLTSGPFQGMFAQRSPIEIFATPVVNGAQASLSDYINLDLIPVFQFAVFSDQEIEYMFPEPSTVVGRLHSNTGVFFGSGADDVSFVNSAITTAGRIHLRDLNSASSQVAGRAPTVNGTVLPCDNAAANRVNCPGPAAWLAYTQASFAAVRDVDHGVTEMHLPTGVSEAAFTATVQSVPDLCGDNAAGVRTQGAGIGRQLSPDWLAIDLPRGTDSSALKTVKFAHTAGIRVIDGVWELRTAGGAYNPMFRQDDEGNAQTQCVYYGSTPAGAAVANSDGVPAIREARIWDYQDRQLRRVQVVDIHRLTRCVPQLEQAGFNGILYFGEDTAAAVDNWGLDPDAKLYETGCAAFQNLPTYLRGQVSSAVGAVPLPAYLANDDVNGGTTPVLDNPYYTTCLPTAGEKRGLGDGPYRIPQGNGNGTREPGRNELVESGFIIREAQRLPNVVVSGRSQGFTIATNMPVYLQGDINVEVGTFSATRTGYAAGKVPHAIVADATTFLSDKYNDLQENPFAPVGPLALWVATPRVAGSFIDNQDNGGDRHWSMLNEARIAPAGADDVDYSNAAAPSAEFEPSSPAPCVNLLRELVMRRRLSGVAGAATNACGANCGLGGLTTRAAGALSFGRDWLTNFSGADIEAGTQSQNYVKAMNKFVAYAPLEAFLDVSMYLNVNPASAAFSSQAIPSERNNREALRDWMRCTLDSGHALADDGSANSVLYPGGSPAVPRAVRMGVRLQGVNSGAPVNTREAGMRDATAGSAAFDVTYRNILGHNGFAPISVTSDANFTVAAGVVTNALFTRDRSSLRDPTGMNNPTALASDLSNLAAASQGDPLVQNVNLLTGSSWMCPQGHPYPTAGANYVLNASATNGGAGGFWNQINGLDEGVYGIFRYQENWYQVDTGSQGNGYIDFYINGSTVVMFNSRESNGRHLINQGFMNNMITGCGGGNDNNHTAQSRACRISSGYEYAWESSRRSIQFDPDNSDAAKLPPGTPKVLSTSRIRWVRR